MVTPETTTGFRPGKKERLIKHRSLHDQVVEQLRDMIVEGEIRPGERIPEKSVCERLGISRTPLREALKSLAKEELVELTPNKGARACLLTAEDVLNRFEVISALESLAGQLAARRASDEQIRELRDVFERMAGYFRSRDLHEYFQLNQHIHEALIEASGNDVLIATHENLMVKVRRPRFFAILSDARWKESVDEHRAIQEALEARDPDRLGRLMGAHTLRTGQTLSRTLGEPAARDP